jgi:hypothetical protein
MANPNKIELTVVTTSGTVKDEYNIHQHLQQVVQHVWRELRIEPAPGEQWELKYGDTVLVLSDTIEQARLPSGARLNLAPREGGGGARWTRK